MRRLPSLSCLGLCLWPLWVPLSAASVASHAAAQEPVPPSAPEPIAVPATDSAPTSPAAEPAPASDLTPATPDANLAPAEAPAPTTEAAASPAASPLPAPHVPAAAPHAPAAPLASGDVDDAPDKAVTSGLALGTGIGSDNVFFGGHAAYYAQLPSERLRIAVHVGAGVTPYGTPDTAWGLRGGSFLAYGLRNRLVVGVYGGTIDWRTYGLHGVAIAQHRENGVGAALGWEWMHESGLYVRASVGPALSFTRDEGLIRGARHLVWRGNFFAIGYKLW